MLISATEYTVSNIRKLC